MNVGRWCARVSRSRREHMHLEFEAVRPRATPAPRPGLRLHPSRPARRSCGRHPGPHPKHGATAPAAHVQIPMADGHPRTSLSILLCGEDAGGALRSFRRLAICISGEYVYKTYTAPAPIAVVVTGLQCARPFRKISATNIPGTQKWWLIRAGFRWRCHCTSSTESHQIVHEGCHNTEPSDCW